MVVLVKIEVGVHILKDRKHNSPDDVPSCNLKELAFELAEPISIIFNESLQSGTVPATWEDSNITTIPKTQPPTCKRHWI